jgi:chemotaxis protein methyltransferase CheR
LQAQLPSGPEITEFINAVTTNKTDFYREPHHFQYVIQQLVPEVERATRSGNRRLRIWHAGCSTGEEPYTMSIELHEALARKEPWQVQQLATDIDSNVVRHAIQGEYELEKLKPVPEELKRRYFLRGTGAKSGTAVVKPVLAEWLAFRRLNLLADPWPFTQKPQFDVIFCRNVMIYFDKPTQRKLIERFREVLTPGGYLMIGHSESLFGISTGFTCHGNTIYQGLGALEEAA